MAQNGSSEPTFASTSPSSSDPPTVVDAPPLSTSPGSPKRVKLSEAAQAVHALPTSDENGLVEMKGVVGGSSVEQIPAAGGAAGEKAGEGSGKEREVVVEEQVFALNCSWQGKKYPLTVPASETVGDLKALVYSLTSVPPERQKIVGLVAGKLPADDVEISSLKLGSKKRAAFVMIGTPEGAEIKRPDQASDVANDLDVDYNAAVKTLEQDPATNTRNRRKLVEAANALQLDIMNPPREGKKLLVLDLDGTLMDVRAYQDSSIHAIDMARPYLQEFMTILYPYYDFCIFSQTNWRWLESSLLRLQKLVELNMVGGLNDDKYKISFVMDRTPMFSVYSTRDGKPFKHEVKALEIIWRKIPQFNARNTVHLDDLSRNGAMNPRNLVKCHAFKDARRSQTDRELIHFAKYFLRLALVDDVREYDHSKFMSSELPLPPGVKDPEEDLPAEYSRDKALRRSRHHH